MRRRRMTSYRAWSTMPSSRGRSCSYNGDIDDIQSRARMPVVAPLSLRLPDELADKVRRMATIERRSLAEMVRLLTEEAVRMREFPDIVLVEGPSGRRASFR